MWWLPPLADYVQVTLLILGITVFAVGIAAIVWIVWWEVRHERSGNQHFAQGRYADAISAYDRAIDQHPNRAIVFHWRGRAHAALDQYENAIADQSRAIELTPSLIAPYIERAGCHFALGQLEQAKTDVERCLQLSPQCDAALFVRAGIASQNNHLEAALADLDRAIELNPDEHFYRPLSAQCLAHLGHYEEARGQFELVLATAPDDSDAACGLALLFAGAADAACRDGARAVELAARACERTEWKDWRSISILAAAHAETGDFDEAIRLAELARELAPEDEKPTRTERIEQYRRHEPFRLPAPDT